MVQLRCEGDALEGLDGSEPGDGQTLLWARLPDVITGVDATTLAILGDYVPFGISQSQGRWWPSNSLDNTIRVVDPRPTDWVLLELVARQIDGGAQRGVRVVELDHLGVAAFH